jgi:hypothetical protein
MALSSIEAKYMEANFARPEAIWICKIDCKVDQSDVRAYCGILQ